MGILPNRPKLMESFDKYPPRKLQSETYMGPLTITRYNKIGEIKALLKQKGIEFPSGN